MKQKKPKSQKNSTKPKVKNRRDKKKYPNILGQYTLKMKQDLVDYDYLDKLNDEELAYLDKFTRDSVHAKMDRKNLSKNTSPTLEWKQECDRKNNAWKNDLMTRMKAGGRLYSTEDLDPSVTEPDELDILKFLNNFEDETRKSRKRTKPTDDDSNDL